MWDNFEFGKINDGKLNISGKMVVIFLTCNECFSGEKANRMKAV